MMGSVYKPNPACRFWYLKYKTISGRWVVESSRLERKEDAKGELKKKEGKIQEGIDVTPSIGKLILDDAFTDLKVNYINRARRSTDEMERRVRLHLVPFFGAKRKMTTITTSDIAKFVAKRQADTIITQHARTIRKRTGVVHLPEIRRPVSPAEINRELTIFADSSRSPSRTGG